MSQTQRDTELLRLDRLFRKGYQTTVILPGSWHYSRARSTGLSQRTLAGRKQSLSRQNDLSEYAAALASSANRVVIHYGNSFCVRLFFFCIFYLLSTLWAGPVLYTLELVILGLDFLSLVYVCTRHAMTYSQWCLYLYFCLYSLL